jgi:hypothetical protein
MPPHAPRATYISRAFCVDSGRFKRVHNRCRSTGQLPPTPRQVRHTHRISTTARHSTQPSNSTPILQRIFLQRLPLQPLLHRAHYASHTTSVLPNPIPPIPLQGQGKLYSPSREIWPDDIHPSGKALTIYSSRFRMHDPIQLAGREKEREGRRRG